MTSAGTGGTTTSVARITAGFAPFAIVGNLTIGAGTTGTGAKTVQLLANNQISTASQTTAVNILTDGVLDLNGHTQLVNSLNMVGGAVDLTGASSVLTLGLGSLTATADAGGNPATITGAGTLSLGGSTRNIIVNGTAPIGLTIGSVIGGLNQEGLVKTGTGTLQLTNVETYTGGTTVGQGTILADAPNSSNTVGAVTLSGGTIGGTGKVASITSNNGTVQPGDSNTSTGTLTSGPVTLNSSSTFFVALNGSGPGEYDQLAVNGNITLGGATLAGFVGSGVNLGDSFTILTTTGGTIQGTFAQPNSPNSVFVGGQKFNIVYTPTSVVLTSVRDTASVAITSSSNPSVYGQDVVFSAKVTPESGSGTIPTTDTVTFILDQGTPNAFTQTVQVGANGIATFDPQLAANQVFTASQHTIDATFNGDGNFSAATAPTFTQTINPSNTTIKLAASSSNPVYGQSVTVTATVASILGAGALPTALSPSGTVTFTVNGVALPSGPVSVNSAGQAQFTLSNLNVNIYRISANYSGDTNYNSSNTLADTIISVQKSASSTVLSVVPTSSQVGQAVSFTAVVSAVSPGSGTATGAVVFTDTVNGSTITLGSVNLSGAGVATLQTSALAVGTHKITASYVGDSNFTASSNSIATFTVGKDGTTTTVSSSENPSKLGDAVTFTANVTSTLSGVGSPSGTVTFTIDSTTVTAALNSSGVATYTTATLGNGTHSVVAAYSGNTTFAASTSPTLNQSVKSASSVTLTSSGTPSIFGQLVTFTATVAAVAPGTMTPQGQVTFTVDGGARTVHGRTGQRCRHIPDERTRCRYPHDRGFVRR